MTHPGRTPSSISRWLNWPIAAVLLVAFAVTAITASLDHSNTFDEGIHLTGGTSYWLTNDYHLHPENGNLPQRWAALPLALTDQFKFPPLESDAWRDRQLWPLSYTYLHEMDNDVRAMLWRGRLMITLLAVAAGALVYAWSRRLFGPAGAIISLLLFCLSPTMLAHGALVTSDMAASLCFLAAVGCLWALMHRVNVATILGGGVIVAGVMLSKFCCLLLGPMAIVMLVMRLLGRRPLTVHLGRRWDITSWPRQIFVLGVAASLQAIVVVTLIWAAFGFRYSAAVDPHITPNQTIFNFEYVLPEQSRRTPWMQRARDLRLLPEAYIYGMNFVLKQSKSRPSFMAGQHSHTGFRAFFPLAFAIKTPLPALLIVLIAVGAALFAWRALSRETGRALSRIAGHAVYRTTPLWTLFIIYWIAAITSHFNVGHRHILPTYLPMFILAGAAASCFTSRRRTIRVLPIVLLLWLAAESWAIRPHYLAYFNQLIGGPRHGYRYLVASSLDWGQELPGLSRWIEHHRPTTLDPEPVYLAYQGSASPADYNVQAISLLGPAHRASPPQLPPFEPGVYCISATHLQSVYRPPTGPWTDHHERQYQDAVPDLEALESVPPDPHHRRQFLINRFADQWQARGKFLQRIRMGRLCAYLRLREPDDHIGYSILIYRLNRHDLNQALWEPWPPIGARVNRLPE